MRRAALIVAALLLAGSAGAVETVLTSEGGLFAIEAAGPQSHIEILHRVGDVRETLVVPGTEDEAVESDARLVFDQATGTLYVAWRNAGDEDQVLLASYDAQGSWSEPVVVTAGPTAHGGLTAALSKIEATTLVHLAWWDVNGDACTGRYALVAFEDAAHVSTDVQDLDVLAAAHQAGEYEIEDTGEATHPPLALAKAADGVDVAFGSIGSTAITRVHITPELEPLARIWKPVGRSGERLPGAKLVSNTTEPVGAFISKGRIVLYTPESQFRFVVFENGRWSPLRMIQLDETFSSDALLHELRKTVDEQAGADDDIVTH